MTTKTIVERVQEKFESDVTEQDNDLDKMTKMVSAAAAKMADNGSVLDPQASGKIAQSMIDMMNKKIGKEPMKAPPLVTG